MHAFRGFLIPLVAALFWASCTLPSAAFDTATHADITEQAMMREGFNREAADVVQVENWLTDFYTSRPLFGSADQCELEKLHFDDVFDAVDIAHYWAELTANTKAAVEAAARADDKIKFLSVLGTSLHVVQDFYAHSNWVEARGTGGTQYRSASWFALGSQRPQTLHTGWYANCLNIPQGTHVPHGGYSGSPPAALNHDSYVRPNWDGAYVVAYAASEEWIYNVELWAHAANSSFLAGVFNLNLSQSDAKALALDRKASIYISEWVYNPFDPGHVDGHWAGNPSGNAPGFAAMLTAWGLSPDSAFVNAFKVQKYFRLLSDGLYSSTHVTQPAIVPLYLQGRAFGMRTLSVYANWAFTGTDSYFGELTPTDVGSGNYTYRDASQYHRPRTDVPWNTLIVLRTPRDRSAVTLRYQLWNEFSSTNNDAVTIQNDAKVLNFSCVPLTLVCTGDISGGPWTAAAPYVTKGNSIYGVELKLYFTDKAIVP